MENIAIIVLIGLGIWYLVGAVVCALLDNENEDLRKWAKSFPYGSSLGTFLVIMCFPVVIYKRLKHNTPS